MPSKTKPPVQNRQEVILKNEVGIFGGISLVVGIIIGSGIFVSPKGVLEGAGSVGMALIIWTCGGFISLCGALSFAELGTMIPKSGAEYSYLLETVHPVFAFLQMFTALILLKPTSLAILSLTFAQYSLGLVYNEDCGPPPEVVRKLLAISVILLVVAVNIFSVKLANKVQIVFTGAKLLALVIIIAGGLVKLGQGHTENLQGGFTGTNSNPGYIALAFYSSMWAYDGWNQLNLSTEELVEPFKTLPKSIFVAIPIVTVVYILTNVSYFTILSKDALLGSDAVALSWAEVVMPGFSWIIPIFVCISTFGAANGVLFGYARLAYVAARERHLVKLLSYIQVERLTPTPALLFSGLVAVLMILPGNIGSLIDFYSFAAWMFLAILFTSLIILRIRKPNAVRPYKVPLLFPVLALAASVFLVIAPIVQAPQIEFLYAFLFILGGLLFYIPFVHFRLAIPGIEKVTMWSVMFLQVIEPTSCIDEQVLSDRNQISVEKDLHK